MQNAPLPNANKLLKAAHSALWLQGTRTSTQVNTKGAHSTSNTMGKMRALKCNVHGVYWSPQRNLSQDYSSLGGSRKQCTALKARAVESEKNCGFWVILRNVTKGDRMCFYSVEVRLRAHGAHKWYFGASFLANSKTRPINLSRVQPPLFSELARTLCPLLLLPAKRGCKTFRTTAAQTPSITVWIACRPCFVCWALSG